MNSFKFIFHFALLSILPYLLSACASLTPKQKFDRYQKSNPIFQDSVKDSAELKPVIDAYLHHEVCPKSKKEFGSIARELHFQNPSVQEIETKMANLNCMKKVDVLRDPKLNKPLLTTDGKTTPLWSWLCDEGSVVRIKPEGDPNSKFIPHPHGSVVLRYPCDSKFENFGDEKVKVDSDGNLLPKWPKELQPKDAQLIQGWSDDAHFRIR